MLSTAEILDRSKMTGIGVSLRCNALTDTATIFTVAISRPRPASLKSPDRNISEDGFNFRPLSRRFSPRFGAPRPGCGAGANEYLRRRASTRTRTHDIHVIPVRLMEISRNVRRGFLGWRNERGHRVLNNALEPFPLVGLRRLVASLPADVRRPVPSAAGRVVLPTAWTQVRRNCPTDSHNLSLSTALRAAKAELLTPRA